MHDTTSKIVEAKRSFANAIRRARRMACKKKVVAVVVETFLKDANGEATTHTATRKTSDKQSLQAHKIIKYTRPIVDDCPRAKRPCLYPVEISNTTNSDEQQNNQMTCWMPDNQSRVPFLRPELLMSPLSQSYGVSNIAFRNTENCIDSSALMRCSLPSFPVASSRIAVSNSGLSTSMHQPSQPVLPCLLPLQLSGIDSVSSAFLRGALWGASFCGSEERANFSWAPQSAASAAVLQIMRQQLAH